MHRRHLSTSQRAAIAAELANLTGAGRPKKIAQNCAITEVAPVSVAQAAKALNVSPRSVTEAKRVMRENPVAHEAAKRGVPAIGKLREAIAAELANMGHGGNRREFKGQDCPLNEAAPVTIEAAAIESKVPCEVREFEGDDTGALAFAISTNMHRRHLSTSQRAAIAAELANLPNGRRLPRSNDRGETPSISVAQAAKALNVGTASVQRAKAVMRENPVAHEAAKRGISSAATYTQCQPLT